MRASVSKSNITDPKTASAATNELEGQVWEETLRFASYGVRAGIRVNRKGVLDKILQCLPPGWKPSRSGKLDRMYSFVIEDVAQRGKRRRSSAVYADDSRITMTPKVEQAIDAFESDLQLFVAETAPHRVFVHAGVVGVRGKAIVIPGRSFSGKTSLVAALVKAGAAYYSDEYAVLDERGLVHHYARPLSIRENGHNRKPKKYQVEALGGRKGAKPLPVAMVVVSKYRPEAQWRPRKLSEGEGALELMANTVSARRAPEAMLEAIRRVVSLAPVLKGDRGDAREVVDFILERFAG